jgi:hypothetical protein
MRKLTIISIAFLFIFGLVANNLNAMPCNWLCCKKDTGASVKKHGYGFYSLGYELSYAPQIGQINPWLNANGYTPLDVTQHNIGFSEAFFRGKWVTEFAGSFSTLKSSSPSICNGSLGIGYNFWNNKLFSAYGIMGVGLNEVYFTPNNKSLNDFGKYTKDDGAMFSQYSLLVDPHILLYRVITPNLSFKPGKFSSIAVGLEAGFHLAAYQSKWTYGYSDSKPFEANTVSGIPNINTSGFYAGFKIGWFFGR